MTLENDPRMQKKHHLTTTYSIFRCNEQALSNKTHTQKKRQNNNYPQFHTSQGRLYEYILFHLSSAHVTIKLKKPQKREKIFEKLFATSTFPHPTKKSPKWYKHNVETYQKQKNLHFSNSKLDLQNAKLRQYSQVFE